MISISEVVSILEDWAPLMLQESYDNSGVMVGDTQKKCTGILVAIDCTEAVVEEAFNNGCNLIIAHHPIIFKGLKQITTNSYVERTIISAIKADITIYAIHTNLDNILHGVNQAIANKIGLTNTSILKTDTHYLSKLITFVPIDYTEPVLNALHDAGAGQIGEYSHCSFTSDGWGTFKPTANANPHTGERERISKVSEKKIEVIFPNYLQKKMLKALHTSHPYEMPAFDLITLNQPDHSIGSGLIGDLPESMTETDFIHHLKTKMNTGIVRTSPLLNKCIKRVALCGGSGSFLIQQAKNKKADVFITSDVKYHEFFDAENSVVIMDINHYDAEYFTKELIIEYLSKKITNIALLLSKVNTNPISYF